MATITICRTCNTAPVMEPNPFATFDHTETVCVGCNDGTPTGQLTIPTGFTINGDLFCEGCGDNVSDVDGVEREVIVALAEDHAEECTNDGWRADEAWWLSTAA